MGLMLEIMTSEIALFLIFGIGVTAGLRTMTAPAVVSWATHMGWIHLSGSHLAFVGSRWAVALFTIGALIEYVVDLLPSTPARTTTGPLAARIVTSILSGACIAVGVGMPAWLGVFIAPVGAVTGAYAGQHLRAGLVRYLRVPDAAIAIPEDLVAVSLGLLCCLEVLKFRVGLAEILAPMHTRWL
jgi:uncharacterized membrane protein